MFKRIFFILIIVLFCSFLVHASTYIQGPALIEQGSVVAKAAGTTTLTVTSQSFQSFTGVTTQTVVLPSALTLPQGRKFWVLNPGSAGLVTVQDTGANTLTTIPALGAKTFYLRDNSTANGTWDIVGQVDVTAVTGILPIANGGTSGTATPTQGGIAYGTGTAYAFSASGAAGTVLTANGSSAPIWTTATFPSAVGSAGTFIRSNGTNWVASTLTIPNTANARAALVVNASDVVSSATANVANRLLRTDGTTITFAQVTLTTDVTGILPIANGGTNGTASPASGAIAYGTGAAYAFNTPGTTSDWALSGGTGAPTFSSTTTTPKVITGSTNAIQLLVTGSSTQSADIFVAEKQDGTDLINVTNVNGTKIRGTTTNDDAATGFVGEYVESVVSAAANFPTSGQFGDCTSISLTAGDWDVSYIMAATAPTTSVVSRVDGGIGTASGTSTTGLVAGSSRVETVGPVANANDVFAVIPPIRKTISATTTYYAKVFASWTTLAPQYTCRISARRVR